MGCLLTGRVRTIAYGKDSAVRTTTVRLALVAAILSPLAGCESATSNAAATETPSEPTPSPMFDPAACGRIAGRVTWTGEIPTCPGFLRAEPKANGNFGVKTVENPHAPRIDPA